MDFTEYIKSELLVLIPVIYLIGVALKKSKFPDYFIPFTLGWTGIVLASVWVFATSDVETNREFAGALFTAITQGILAAGAAVYANQLYLQSKKKE